MAVAFPGQAEEHHQLRNKPPLQVVKKPTLCKSRLRSTVAIITLLAIQVGLTAIFFAGTDNPLATELR